MLDIIQIPVLNDNYIYLIHDPVSTETAVVDPAVSEPVLDALASKEWQLTYIFNTHHHNDHVGANLELKQKTNCQIFGSEADRKRIPGIDVELKHGDQVKLGDQVAHVISTPGHTLGHIVYHFPDSHALFCGDTLFSMGCGRLFEGSPTQMWQSLQLLKDLPGKTDIYCAHEYTQANGKFALTLEPDNPQLQQRLAEVKQLRSASKSTIPSSLDQELATNPFLREHSPAIQQSLNMTENEAVKIFAKVRELKDRY